jgi:hypothetical protein
MVTTKSPVALAAPRALENNCLTKLVSSQNSHSQSEPQADLDANGESDLKYFRRRPNVTTRTRLPFAGEFPAVVMELARGRTMFVHVVMMRDPMTNEPTTRGRGIFYTGGGTA